MLEGSDGGQSQRRFQLPYQLPRIEGIQKIDVSGATAQHPDRQFGAVLHVDACRLLIGITAVFQFQFFHTVFLSV